ncbi:MAG: TetR/AcrR family transcriptional regulator [Bacteroidetes bacterium]|nr:MAG: TetR/AcrR family transcriptional regulator [Bacteroidota bacterium]
MKDDFTRVLESTNELFMRYGIRSVSMDDVAREVGMSKKTIYQHFTDRTHLVDAVIEHHIQTIKTNCDTICYEMENPIDQLLEIARYFHSLTRQMNPTLLFDLKKYFPQSWKKLSAFRLDQVHEQISDNLLKGREMGLYRTDFNIDIVVKLYIHLVGVILDDDLFPKVQYTFKELHHEMLMYHLHGISTFAGIEYLHEKQSKNE